MPNHELVEGVYQMKKLTQFKESKYKAGFVYNQIKLHGFVPPAKDVPFLHPWGQDPYFKTSVENKRGKLNKDPKITFAERIMRDEKRKGVPAAKYKFTSEFDIEIEKIDKGNKAEKFLSFVEDEIARGQSVPGPIYNPNFNSVDPAEHGYKFPNESEWAKKNDCRINPIKKNSKANPGAEFHDISDAFNF